MIGSRLSLRTLHCAAASFEAARQLDHLPATHRSHRLHGHSFLARVQGVLPAGWAGFKGGEVQALRAALQQQVDCFDYRLLNQQVAQPTDENLARWLRDRLDVPGVEQIGLQSTADQGVLLDGAGRLQVWRRYRFHSAHWLPNVPAGHKCGRLHGHGFEVLLHATAGTDAAHGDTPDFDQLDLVWAPFQAQLDHTCLNDLPGLQNPTSEVLSSWLWAHLQPRLPQLCGVTVYETGSCGAHFDGGHHRIWKELTLDSALQLRHAPEGSPLRRIHGHTYTLRLHLTAPLDQVLGWTVDFGDVKTLFNPLFRQLDHQPLHEIAGLDDCDTATLAQWVLGQARPQLPQLDRVDLYETRGCGAIALSGAAGPALPV